MERQNVTLSLPKYLLKKAKILAATREKSLSELLRESPEDRIREANGYNKARKRQLKLLKEGNLFICRDSQELMRQLTPPLILP